MSRILLDDPWPVPNGPVLVGARGYALLRDPLLNKGAGFTGEERTEFSLHGMLPGEILSIEEQARREFRVIESKDSDTARFLHLATLMSQNKHLFYRVLSDNLEALMPIVYTPTVAWATRHVGRSYQPHHGLWLTPAHQGRMATVLRGALGDRSIRLIVATDNESILGIGDQGAGGIAISIGKLALYTAGAGIPPAATLPLSLDVGTANTKLLEDPDYPGWRAPRLRGEDYEAFIDEFVAAVSEVCPGALIQWEDFRKDSAERILARHRQAVPSFNDDIQGTGAVALAGIQSACRLQNKSLQDHRIVVFGAGAAGLGIARQLINAMRLAGLDPDKCRQRVAVLDSRGLLVDDQSITEDYKRELAWPAELARHHGLGTGNDRDLLTVVQRYRPTVLIGTSGQAGSFTQAMIEDMARHCERPLIMPFSNPTAYAEATPVDVLRWSDGRALVATGSPFPPVDHNGIRTSIGQGNNVFIFPGLGLGALLARAGEITDTHVTAAASALAAQVSDSELAQGQLFPSVDRLREISLEVATAVAACILRERGAEVDDASVRHAVAARMWQPHYSGYVATGDAAG